MMPDVISKDSVSSEYTMTNEPALALAQDICRTNYADLPTSAVASARRDILDTFGCMLGGSGSPGIDELFAVAMHWGGREESRVLLRATRLPAPQAALLNASMGHALDFDDTLDTGGALHPRGSVLPPLPAPSRDPAGLPRGGGLHGAGPPLRASVPGGAPR